jgi:hypothetical protein
MECLDSRRSARSSRGHARRRQSASAFRASATGTGLAAIFRFDTIPLEIAMNMQLNRVMSLLAAASALMFGSPLYRRQRVDGLARCRRS